MVDRSLAARSALGSVRAEGIEPSADVVAAIEGHAAGRVSDRQLAAVEQQVVDRYRARAVTINR